MKFDTWFVIILLIVSGVITINFYDSGITQEALINFIGDNTIEGKMIEFDTTAEIEKLQYSKVFFNKNYSVQLKYKIEDNEFKRKMNLSEVEYNRLLSLKNIEVKGEILKKVYEDQKPKYILSEIRIIYPE